jgi:hypothetical protein
MKRSKFLLALFFAGMVAVIVGAYLKIMHLPGGVTTIGIGMIVEAGSIVLIAAKIMSRRTNDQKP